MSEPTTFTCPTCQTHDDNCTQIIAGVTHCEDCYHSFYLRRKVFTCKACEKVGWTRDAYWCLDVPVCDEDCACEVNEAIADARDYSRLMEESKRW